MKDVRQEYHAPGLTEADLLADPVEQARRWVDDAINAELPLANAMTLATVSADGRPSSRVVLLKGIEDGGFVFFTHYDSRKGDDIAANPNVSFVMFWGPFDRQLIVNGRAEKIPAQQSRDYFASRPRGSQLSAAVSHQSPPAGSSWKRIWPSWPSSIRKGRPYPCLRPGVATASFLRRFSSGMGGLAGCMTGFATVEKATAGHGSA
jgi:pyridoxamine 5'-phosphate oxidase